MKQNRLKRVFAIVLTIFLAFFLYIFLKLLPDIYTDLGKNAYEEAQYKKAEDKLRVALFFNPKNKDARFYMANALIKLPPSQKVQKELFEIYDSGISDSAALISEIQISKWRNQIKYSIGDNYIEKAPMDNKISRWDISKFPLRVYYKDFDSVPSYYRAEISEAFSKWQKTGIVKFFQVANENDADIVISSAKTNLSGCSGDGCKYVVANTSPEINGNILKRMDIAFNDVNNLDKPFSKKEIFNTALHEIGHALGIMGHSDNSDDIMYMESDTESFSDLSSSSDWYMLSPRDINTLRLLYMLTPDISNTPMINFDTSKQFFAPIVLGSEKQITSRKIEEAEKYIQAAPNLPNGYIDLAAAYSEMKEYKKAIDTLNKGLDISTSDMEKFIIFYNYAVIYSNLQDWENALSWAKKAQALQTDSDIDGLIASIYFNKGDRAQAKILYEQTFAKNPSNTIDAVNLSRIYLREFNLVKAGHVLNELVKSNPDAKYDNRVKIFGLLMFFFR